MSKRIELSVNEADYNAVIDYLKINALGLKNAKRRKQLEHLVRVSPAMADRLIRKIAQMANQRGVPVASGNDGYFYAETFLEFDDGLHRMRSQRDEMHKRIQTIERLRFKLFGDQLQPTFSGMENE